MIMYVEVSLTAGQHGVLGLHMGSGPTLITETTECWPTLIIIIDHQPIQIEP